MTGTAKFCLGLLLLLLIVLVLSYLPAAHQVQWFLRVAVPEIGWSFLALGVPAGAYFSRSHPKLGFLLLAALITLVLVPWVQAMNVASQLQADWSQTFPKHPDRSPLILGERGRHTKSTQEYKPGFEWSRYSPINGPKAKLLFVHGGSWRNGGRDDYPKMFEYLADRDIEVLSPTYTLSGTAAYPAAYNDISAAIEKAHDPEVPLFVAGRSSGGHLALLASYTHPKLVKGVIGIYPPVDMVWSYENPSNPAVLDSQEAIREFLLATPEDNPERYKEASPIDQVGAAGPPTLLIHGLSDCLVFHRQSEMLSERLDQLGVRNYLLSMPWTEHGGEVFISGPSGRLSAWAIEGFIDSLR
jgi:acetyl esterase/lipase